MCQLLVGKIAFVVINMVGFDVKQQEFVVAVLIASIITVDRECMCVCVCGVKRDCVYGVCFVEG